jgi:hypothetical protein
MFATPLRRARAAQLACFSLSLLLSACGGSSDDDGSDAGDQTDGDAADDGSDGNDDGGSGACEAPEYGNGTCDTSIDGCAAPDIDCFVTFDDQGAADDWYLEFEQLLAMQEFREPRAVLSTAHPDFARMRSLLDQGWAAYQEVNPVADLASYSPALIIIEDPSINAFVIPDLDSGNAGFAVIVQSGLLDQVFTDEAMLGLVMHELEHAIGLHIVGDVRDQLRTFYIAGDVEPFGFEQLEDPAALEYGSAWRELASEAGPFTQEELGGLPFGTSQLNQIFNTVVSAETQANPAACSGPSEDLDQLNFEIGQTFSGLDADLDLENGPFREDVDAVLIAMRDECLAGFPQDFIEVVAEIAGVTPQEITASLTQEDLDIVVGVHFVDAVAGLAVDRRIRMTELEEQFEDETGTLWDSLRYYSFEEAADDATVPVLENMALPANGLADFLFDVQDPGTRAACDQLLDFGETPPYGADLSDEHHATCWRVDHVDDLAESGALSRRSVRKDRAKAGHVSRRRLIPRKLSDLIIY